MNIFFDTSSFISLYYEERDTEKLLRFLTANPGYKIYLSELTLVEAYSAILKKVRTKHISLIEAEEFLTVLDNDLKSTSLVALDSSIIARSQKLIVDYGTKGLRALDAIQLASVLSIKDNIDLVLTGDKALKKIFTDEGFNCEI